MSLILFLSLKGELKKKKKKKLIDKYRGWVFSVPSPTPPPSYSLLNRWQAHEDGMPAIIARQSLLSLKS